MAACRKAATELQDWAAGVILYRPTDGSCVGA